MKIAISQPRYLPASNYIERIIESDLFVMLDVVQHQKRAFEHRNKIKVSSGSAVWLSIPLKRVKSYPLIKDLEIDNDEDWYSKHFRSIELNYKQTPYYKEIIPLLTQYYTVKKNTLNQAVKEMLNILLNYLEVDTRIIWCSEQGNWEKKNEDLLLEITTYFGGDTYISGPNGRNYITKEKFREKNIKLIYHDYQHPIYPQLWGEFIPYMTIWDMMFNCGKDTIKLIKSGTFNDR